MIEQLDQWLIASSKYLDELPPKMPANDKFDKIAKIAKQLGEQQAHLSHLKRLVRIFSELILVCLIIAYFWDFLINIVSVEEESISK